MDYQILLYYKYVPISDPEALKTAQRELCEELGLKGRIIVAKEGINGTVGGSVEATEAYIQRMTSNPLFTNIHWKKSFGPSDTFPRLTIKVREEIVTTKITDVELDPTKETATHLKPEELYSWYREGRSFKVIDMRNSMK